MMKLCVKLLKRCKGTGKVVVSVPTTKKVLSIMFLAISQNQLKAWLKKVLMVL